MKKEELKHVWFHINIRLEFLLQGERINVPYIRMLIVERNICYFENLAYSIMSEHYRVVCPVGYYIHKPNDAQ